MWSKSFHKLYLLRKSPLYPLENSMIPFFFFVKIKPRKCCKSINHERFSLTSCLIFVWFVPDPIHSAIHQPPWRPCGLLATDTILRYVGIVHYGTIWFSRRISGFGAPFDFHAPRRNCTSTLAAGTALFRRKALAPPTKNFKYFPALSASIMKTFKKFLNYLLLSKQLGSNFWQFCNVFMA